MEHSSPENSSLDNSSLGYFFARTILRQIILRPEDYLLGVFFAKSKNNGSSPAKNHPSEVLSGEELSALT
jgi:hypothetical protein